MSKRMDGVYVTVIGISLAVIVAFIVLAIIRFIFGGPEDTWICTKGGWVKHGNPLNAPPAFPCPR